MQVFTRNICNRTFACLVRQAKRLLHHPCANTLSILCFSLLFLFADNAYAQASKRPKKKKKVETVSYHGIDVSKYQGEIDWKAVASDRHIQFVYIKATEGSGMVDRMYRCNIEGARRAGLKVGSYHFFTSRSTPEAQFENYCRNVKSCEQDLIPMVDVEESGVSTWGRAELQRNLATFMNLVKEKFGMAPLLYSQYQFYNDFLAPEFNKYYIFIARYGKQKPVLRGGGRYNIWQYSETGKVKGIVGPVDLSCFANGTSIRNITYVTTKKKKK